MKKTRDTLPPPGGRRAKPKKDMKKSAPCSTITAFPNLDKEADVKKCAIKRSEIDFALWQKIERLKRAIDKLYTRPNLLSDPYEDFSKDELNELVSIPDNRIGCHELLCLFQSHCPAGCYEESVYFLPLAVNHIETRQDGASSVLDNLLGWMDENRHALGRDKLWRLCVSCFVRIIGDALSEFRLFRVHDPHARGQSIYPVDCDLLDGFLAPIAPSTPILAPIVLRKVFRNHFSSIDSYPAAAWLVYLGTHWRYNPNPYLLERLTDSGSRNDARRFILEKCRDEPLGEAFWKPILLRLAQFDNLSEL